MTEAVDKARCVPTRGSGPKVGHFIFMNDCSLEINCITFMKLRNVIYVRFKRSSEIYFSLLHLRQYFEQILRGK